jgi:eukaryotic-like serine/threonine-protein kinase
MGLRQIHPADDDPERGKHRRKFLMENASHEIELLLFDAALQISDESTRRAFLNQTCAGHPEMRRHLEKLLEAEKQSDAYFSGVTEACAAAAEPFPHESLTTRSESNDRIGPYRLLERIGEGGCGVVYLAEQEEPVRRRVALKVIRPGMDTERVIARFEVERQALAMMDHPNIAHVLDAGTTPTGRPYFAMEWVRGRKITDFCDEQQLGIRQRLELFIKVCQAIQHAHQKGVIHRDIKPSNVLVWMQDGKPQPKVIDFGIAKATGGSVTPGLTEVNDLPMGTLASMSPEQAASGGIDVDTRSDVYSLGILLYELLCGRPAFDPAELGTASYPAALEILLHREVPAPSVRIAGLTPADAADLAACRGTDPAKWIAAIQGDLDHVTLACLEKDRSRRYETVNGLALDVARFLANEPVFARPPSQFYRFRKFIDRNRATCISVFLITLTVLAGLAVSTAMYLRENAALKEQQRLLHIAEIARTAEARLRQQAQARANVSHASLLLSQGRTDEADATLRQSPLSTIEPSREATEAFRALGDWHLLHHRWNAAAECYLLLPLANRFIPSEEIAATGDMIRTAPVLLLAGMNDAYDAQRLVLVERFASTTTLNTAEQLVKMCLLRPAPPEVIELLRPAAAFLKESASTNEPRMTLLVNTALALYELRSGNPAEAVVRADNALALVGPASRDFRTLLGAILVIACHQTGDASRAEAEARIVRDFIKTHDDFDKPSAADTPSFVAVIDTALAMILAREAMATLPAASGSH